MIKEFILDKYWVSATRVTYKTANFEAEYSLHQINPNWIELSIRPGSHSSDDELLEYICKKHWIKLSDLKEDGLKNPFWKFYKVSNFNWWAFNKPYEAVIEESRLEKIAATCDHISDEDLEKILEFRKQHRETQ